MDHHVIIALGSNLGDRLANLEAAIAGMATAIRAEAASSVYLTPPWGITDQPAFLNQVIRGSTALEPIELLDFLKDLERTIGRKPAARYGPRMIDLDILFYDNLILKMDRLTIPHPELHTRAFVLVPLAEVAPDWIHPVSGLRSSELLAMVDDGGIEPYMHKSEADDIDDRPGPGKDAA